MEVYLDMNCFHFLGLIWNEVHSNSKQILMHILTKIISLLQTTCELDGFPMLIGSSFEVGNDEILFEDLKYDIKFKSHKQENFILLDVRKFVRLSCSYLKI